MLCMSCPTSVSAHQLCELAGLYAATGDEAFRTRLYEIVEGRPFADEPTLGETEILALDGESAFVFAARVRGQALLSREWEWDDGSLVDSAISQCGEPELRNLLEASPDAAVRRFRDAWVAHRQKSAEKTQIQSHRESMRAVPVEEIFRAAEGDTKCYWFRGWGMHASEPELQAVLQRLWTVREPLVIWNLISVFAARALPEFDARFIEFCRHDDGEIRHKAFHALRKNADPRVRALALAELQEGLRDGYVAGLFINNYQQGDERLILDALELPEDACELHWLLTAVNDVLENNTEADCSQLGVIVYALTPCENCRFHAARRLHQQQRTPAWLREECQFDSAEECRKLVNQLADTTEPL